MKKLITLLMILILLILPGLASQTQGDYTPEELLLLWYQVGSMLRENGAYPYVELRKGDTGYEVMALQTRLKDLSYYDKEVVPTFGGGTETAMRRFEKVNKLKINGWASVEDQQLLFKSLALASNGVPFGPQATGISGATSLPIATATPGAQITGLSTVPPTATPKPPTTAPVTPTPLILVPASQAPYVTETSTAAPATTAPPTAVPPTPEPPTPTPDNTLGDPPSVTLNPGNIFRLPTDMFAFPGNQVTPLPNIVSDPPVKEFKPVLDFSVPHY